MSLCFSRAVRKGGLITRTGAGLLLALWCAAAAQAQGEAQPREPAAATPGWLSLTGSYRLRYEHMDNTFRIVGPDQDELLVSRLRLHARATGKRFYGGIEIEDARAWLDQDLTPVGTDDANALEPLRVYAGYNDGQRRCPGRPHDDGRGQPALRGA